MDIKYLRARHIIFWFEGSHVSVQLVVLAVHFESLSKALDNVFGCKDAKTRIGGTDYLL